MSDMMMTDILSVLRIRDVYPGSRIRIFSIPDPGSASKNFKYFNPKKWFLSSRKYDPGCSSQIRIPDPGSRGQTGTGSWIQGSKRHRILDPGVKKASDPRSRVPKAPDPRSRGQKDTGAWIQGSKRHRILNPGVIKAPDPRSRSHKDTGSWIQGSKRHRILDPGVKKAPDPGSRGQKAPDTGSATLHFIFQLFVIRCRRPALWTERRPWPTRRRRRRACLMSSTWWWAATPGGARWAASPSTGNGRPPSSRATSSRRSRNGFISEPRSILHKVR